MCFVLNVSLNFSLMPVWILCWVCYKRFQEMDAKLQKVLIDEVLEIIPCRESDRNIARMRY